MELIAKISKGSKMDQVYIPKNRFGLSTGSYVIIRPIGAGSVSEKPYFYNIKSIEPIKLEVIAKIFQIIDRYLADYKNIIVAGSFLEKGFNFNDLDLVIIAKGKHDLTKIKSLIEKNFGIKPHFIMIDNKTLKIGLETDPLYQLMLSKCISKKRIIYNYKNQFNYKLLDLHLLKSKVLISNFDILNGNEKYYLTRNTAAIKLYLKNKKLTKETVDNEIRNIFNLRDVNDIKENKISKQDFIKQYKLLYDETLNIILEGIKNESKPE